MLAVTPFLRHDHAVMFKGLLAFKAPTAADIKSLPTRILIVPWGVHQTNKGVVVCNATTVRELPLLQQKLKRDRVALDFQHNTVEDSPSYQGEPAKVAAFGTLEIVEGEGIYLSAIEWTPEGKEAVAGGHYPDISPAVVRNKAGEVIFVHSAGLVRQGEIDGLTLFAATEFLKVFNSENNPNQNKNNMDYKAALLALLGLEPDADDASIQDAIKTYSAKAKPAPVETDKADKTDEVDVKALAAEVKELKGRVVSFDADKDSRERAALVAQASSEGKVIPLSADEVKLLPVTLLSAMITKLPVTVPVERRTAPVESFSATEPTVRGDILKNLGLTKEQFAKHNG